MSAKEGNISLVHAHESQELVPSVCVFLFLFFATNSLKMLAGCQNSLNGLAMPPCNISVLSNDPCNR